MLARFAARAAALRSGANRNVALLALTSLFADISTEMIYPALPLFLTMVLGAPASAVGLIEGIATGIQYSIQGPAGALSDRLRWKKPIGAAGYALSALGKLVIGLAPAWPVALLGRAIDRFGAGSRSAPRDALIAASAPPERRGLAFGLEGLGDNGGAFIGPLVTILLVSVLNTPLRAVFLVAFLPGVFALALFLLVREKREERAAPTAKSSAPRLTLRSATPAYRRYLLVTGLFGIGNSTNAFLILRLEGIGATFTVTVLVYAFFNLVAALVSAPFGAFADHPGGPKRALLGCLLIFALVYFGFALSANVALLALLFVGYGVFQGGYRAVGKTYASNLTSAPLRASGLGWYATVIGLSSVVASAVGGLLWTQVAPEATFLYGCAFALVGILALLTLAPGSGASPREGLV